MENRYSVSHLSKAVLTSALLIVSTLAAFSQFYENFDSKNKAALTSEGWGYYPTSGISLISNSNAYSGRSLFTNAGGGTWEIVATPCLFSNMSPDTLDFYFMFETTTGWFKVGWQKATESVPGPSLTWIDSFYVNPLWIPASLPFNPPSYPYRIIWHMNTPGASFDKFGIDEVLIRHATALGTCLLMPVQLISFNANTVSSTTGANFQVELKWETASEVNISHYEIQRGFGINNFQTVGVVQASGSSNYVHSYSYTDLVSGLSQCYYRLVSVDHNGSTSTSSVEHEIFSAANSWHYSSGAIYYYGEGDALLEVYSVLGNKIASVTLASNSRVDLEKVPPGIYLVKVGLDIPRKIMVTDF